MTKSPAPAAIAKAFRISSALCDRPISSRVLSFIVWGFMLILPTPFFARDMSLSSVTVSGRPASTVNSLAGERSKLSRTSFRSSSSCSAESVVGVPPPIYTVSMTSFFSRDACPAYLISFLKGFKISFYLFRSLLIRSERAVKTSGGAKRYPDIQTRRIFYGTAAGFLLIF